MKNLMIAILVLAPQALPAAGGFELNGYSAADIKATALSVQLAPALPAAVPEPVTAANIPGRYVAKLAVEGPYYAVEMIVKKDSTLRVKAGNMDEVSPWLDGGWKFQGREFVYTLRTADGNLRKAVDLSGVSRSALREKSGVLVTVDGLPFRMWETDKPFFPESGKSAGPAAGALQGNYAGRTPQGRDCGVRFDSGLVQISWTDGSGGHQACGFFPKNSAPSSGPVELSGGSEFSICRAKLTLNDEGIPVSARLGISSMIWLGYDETCLNLERK